MNSDEAAFQDILPLGDRSLVAETATLSCMNPYLCVAGFDIGYFSYLESHLLIIRCKGYVPVFIFIFTCDKI